MRVPGAALGFELAGRGYALDLTHVAGVAECGPVRPVPGAPSAVVGLVEWRGRILTLVDLPRLLQRPRAVGPPSVIRLAPPFEQIALLLRAPLQVIGIAPEHEAGADRERLDPAALVRLAGRGRAGGS